MDKKEVISKLYSIRAALSYISIRKDLGTQDLENRNSILKQDIDSKDVLIKENKSDIEKCNYDIDIKKREIKDIDKNIENLSEKADGSGITYDKNKSDFAFKHQVLITAIIVISIFVIFGVILKVFPILATDLHIIIGGSKYKGNLFDYGLGGLVDLIIISIIVTLIMLPIPKIRYKIYKSKALKKYKDEARNEFYEANIKRADNIETKKSEIKSIQNRIPTYENNILVLKDERKEILSKGKSDINSIANAMKNECDSVYKATLNSFSNTLDSRDWKYVDYIIYAMETGRADNIKEALLSLDRFVQNKEIVQAINSIGETIVRSIEMMTIEIKNSINEASKNICIAIKDAQEETRRAIEKLNKKVSYMSGTIADSLSSISSNISSFNSSQELTNSLLKKSNETSEKLVRDYEYVSQLTTDAHFYPFG